MQMHFERAGNSANQSTIARLSAFDDMARALVARMKSSPQRIALHDLDQQRSYSYAEAARRIGVIHGLLTRQGIKPGDSVATNFENGPDLAFLILASLTFGTRLALIESQTPSARLKYFLDMVEPHAVFLSTAATADVAVSDGIQQLSMPVDDLAKPDEVRVEDYERYVRPDNEAIVIFSSGTTGNPKGVVHTHGNIVAELDAMIEAYDFVESMQHYMLLPLAHVSGLYRSLLMPFFTGGTIHLRRQFDPQAFWGDIEKQDVEFVQLVPSHVALLNRSKHGPKGDRRLSLRYVGTASGYLPPKEQIAFEDRFGIPVLQGYGLTECTCGIVLNSLDGSIRRPGVAGLPLKVNEIRIVDNSGIEVEQGEVGEVLVKGKNVATRFLGYEGPAFEQGWLKTGDMGRIEEDGNIVLVGRRANIINRGAYKIYALEVEEALATVSGVGEAAIIGVPHPILGQDIVAFVTLDQQIDPAQLLGALRAKISSFKIPSQIIPLEKMPQNRLGKVVKDDLLQIYLGRQIENAAFADEEAVLPRLCQLVADIFATDVASIKANSSRETVAQWDSLGHVQVLAAIEQTFGVRIDEEAAVAAQSVADLAGAIAHAVRNKGQVG
jgi:acyl-CoA synthetase (AMP-forming)/AMP-acid ligase II/acyl carrier protein